MLSILCVRLTIKVKVGIPESFKVGWYPPKKTGSSHLKGVQVFSCQIIKLCIQAYLFLKTLILDVSVFFSQSAENLSGVQILWNGDYVNATASEIDSETMLIDPIRFSLTFAHLRKMQF